MRKVREELEMLLKYNKKSKANLSRLMDDETRFDMFSRRFEGLLHDFSRTSLDRHGMELLLDAARSGGVAGAKESLFAGHVVNVTEKRPAMHMALRSREATQALTTGEREDLELNSARMLSLAADLHRGRLPGRDQKVTDIIHVGIGGSLLGPKLVCEALGNRGGPAVHFIGSVDAHHRLELLERLDPHSSVVVLVSKSFSTPDTLIHGQRLIAWLTSALGPETAMHRVFAVTGHPARAAAMGIAEGNTMRIPDWVGGRYSLWSAASLSAAACCGTDRFGELLRGAESMDRHFLETDLPDNLPVLSALVGLWHRNVCGYESAAVIPYDQRLRLLPSYLQQLVMESNGKSVRYDGLRVDYHTSPVLFGEPGTDAQHSIFQALHQGTNPVPLQLIGVIRPDHDDQDAHRELLSNMLAQATALARGRSPEQTRELLGGGADESLVQHRSFEGNRPSEILLLDQLSPRNLGALIALYEHRVFVESVIWEINAFDQWGVELGKTMAGDARRALEGGPVLDASLAGLVRHILENS